MPTGHFIRTAQHKLNISHALKGMKKPWLEAEKIEKVCPCGKIFYLTPSKNTPNRGKFCSRVCYYEYPQFWNRMSKKGIKRPPFSEEWKEKIAISRVTKGIARGSKNPNWKGGLTKIQVVIRNSYYYKKWRELVYGRDSYTCQECGIEGNGKNLNAEHKNPLSLLLRKYAINNLKQAMECSELWDINNGITLCISCHKKTDSYGWKIWNNYLKNPSIEGRVINSQGGGLRE